jgi:hypothetical protein
MKKAGFIFILIIVLSCLISCTKSEVMQSQNAASVMPTPKVCAAPIRVESEEAFIKATRSEDENEMFNMKDIKYYYRAKTLPANAILKYVEVFDTYVMFVYTLDNNKESKDLTKNIKLMWFRRFNDSQAYIQDITSRLNCKTYALYGQIDNTTFMSDKSFNEAKAAKEETGNPTWGLFWVQDGACFEGSVPWTISEEDIAKYLEMEKVVIE